MAQATEIQLLTAFRHPAAGRQHCSVARLVPRWWVWCVKHMFHPGRWVKCPPPEAGHHAEGLKQTPMHTHTHSTPGTLQHRLRSTKNTKPKKKTSDGKRATGPRGGGLHIFLATFNFHGHSMINPPVLLLLLLLVVVVRGR